jgi:TIGR03009 family protein
MAMRSSWLVLTCVLLGGTAVEGQQQPQPAAAVTLDPRNKLDSLLLQWEGKMKEVKTLSAQVVREAEDPTFRTKEIYEGTAKYMAPNFASLDLHRRDRPTLIEKFICTGTYLYEYKQQENQVRVHQLDPPKPGQVADDNFLSFLFGMKAEEAKGRYEISLFKEDGHYYYLKILPTRPTDKADFKVAYLVLIKTSFLPRMLVFDDPSGKRVQWDIPMINNGAQLDRREFTQPTVPRGWKMVPAPKVNDASRGKEPPPQVVRPKS